jgi:Tfp pilus assembly protein PilF
LEKAAKLAKVRSPETVRFAQFKLQNGAAEEAKAFLANVVKQAPDFIPAWQMLAGIANNEAKYDDALKLAENALCRDPENIESRSCWDAFPMSERTLVAPFSYSRKALAKDLSTPDPCIISVWRMHKPNTMRKRKKRSIGRYRPG